MGRSRRDLVDARCSGSAKRAAVGRGSPQRQPFHSSGDGGAAPPTHIEAVKRLMQDAHAGIIASDRKKPIRHEGVRKESSGYAIHEYADKADLVDLIVGSEGTLAIVVAIQFLLAPAAGATSSVLGSFPSLQAAATAATRAAETGATACET